MNYTISNHAAERYAERILSFTDKGDITAYIKNNTDKICDDINSMIKYGELIYEGIPLNKKYGTNMTQIFIKHNWIVIADAITHNVITLYAVRLGLEKEFDIEYCKRMCDKVRVLRDQLYGERESNKAILDSLTKRINELKDAAAAYEKELKDIKSQINEIEASKDAICKDNSKLDKEIRDHISRLIGVKYF